MYQNTWDRAKEVIENRFIVLNIYIRKIPQINILSSNLRN